MSVQVDVAGALGATVTRGGSAMNVQLVITVDHTQTFPTGTVGGQWDFTVKTPGGQVVKHSSVATPDVTYSDLLPGDYIAEGKRLATTFAPLGPTKTAAFTVPDPGVQIDVAGDLAVHLS